ncbi:hypothetical protein [Opitutus terrae]|uniref:Deoxyribose-phosphate aldolase/phospho-2-dehydro-3-deoxyheptonate aldolase n=1 Tax=Opitutus terrae (strain DSM 11246 / JCM 15787 / PB90-1) TaxID=452637 RepID=B2A025_OPITP|nr:hypothetical protein [Opitutus terrae]ACB77361.1 conserved hypothetical protein [Opitutus terrae PB90-1]
MPVSKTLDEKLRRLRAGTATRRDFILADAKDGDMAFGVTTPGPHASGRWRSLEDYRMQIREIVRERLVDIMLLSVSNLEQLAIKERLFADSPVTPAARANDTTDIWMVRGGVYPQRPSRPFRTAAIEHILHGRLGSTAGEPVTGADLGLYSLTFTNEVERDLETVEAFREFRIEAEQKRFRYFLEVFNPNVGTVRVDQIGEFLNDHIIRVLAGVPTAARPLFLKIPYNGPAALEELVAYDPNLIVGILGGGAGTTRDAFQLIHDAQHHGARVALFGRKINLSEHPLTFVAFLRRIVDGEIEPAEAVRAYHGELAKLGVKPHRPLARDLQRTPVARKPR